MPDEAWLALLQASAGADPRPWHTALLAAGSAAALVAKSAREQQALGLERAAIRRLHDADREQALHWRRWLDGPERALLTFDSVEYPTRLAQLPDAPLALWTIGAGSALLGAPQLAIVGSRNPTAGGRATAEAFASYFSARGITVTSGLAMGIDAAAHRGALRGPGNTIAVLGCGIDTVYPRSNEALAAAVARGGGLIVSEYPPGTPARAFRFPQRNRVIAGLSLGTLVVEATRRSGSLITARLAGEYGREVFAIPGSIHNPLSRGCHRLLRDGAKLVEDGRDVLLEFAPLIELEGSLDDDGSSASDTSLANDPAYAKLVNLLGFGPVSMTDMMAGAGLTAAELSSMLLLLEMEGHVEALPGGRYCRLVKRS
jgi:DNA processing protein